MPSSVQAPGRRAVLAVLGAGLVAGCTAPAVGTTTKLAGGTTTKPTPKPTPKPTTSATPKPAASPTPKPSSTPTPTPTPIPSPPVGALPNLAGTDQVWHLLRRATFGPTRARRRGPRRRHRRLARPAARPRRDWRPGRHGTPLPDAADDHAADRAAVPQCDWDAMFELGTRHAGPGLFSKRQLFEVMVEFWSNHFSVTCPSTATSGIRRRSTPRT